MNLAFRLSTQANARVGVNGERIRAASLASNPNLNQWLAFRHAGLVDVFPGKVEIGQGIVTALAQIVAEELDLKIEQVRMVPAGTDTSPDEAVTSGSLSIQECGTALRQASAHARALLLQAAADKLGVPATDLVVKAGTILPAEPYSPAGAVPTNVTLTYWTLADAIQWDVEVDTECTPKPFASHHIVGQPVARRDLSEKVFGQPRLIHDLQLPDMLHGRIVRPSTPNARLESVDTSTVEAMPGVVAVVRDGSFLGVVARLERQAAAAAAQLATLCKWSSPALLPDSHNLTTWLKSQPLDTKVIDQRVAPEPLPTSTCTTLAATYARGFVAHASIGHSCALATWHPHNLEIWTHSQGIFNQRTDMALAFGRAPESIVVHHVEGAGCYGHNGADDVAFDAALLARAVPGQPVRLAWTRAQELGTAPFSPAMCVDLQATMDGGGRIVDWHHDVWSNGHGTRPGRAKTPAFRAATDLAAPFEPLIAVNAPLAAGGGSERNAVPAYDFPSWTITNHRLLTMPLRTSAMRSLGGHCNVFALESFVDEIAHALGEDALAFRLRHLSDPRALDVLQRAASMGQWSSSPAAENTGKGLAFARYKNTGAYCAVVAEVEVERAVRVRKLWVAVDVGLIINPDGVRNQVEGGAIQTVSFTLKEAVAFDAHNILSDSWEHYPILTFSEVPEVEIDLISRPELPALGAGEAAQGPVAAAIGNAVFNAIGVRVRAMPMTPECLITAMQT